MFCSPKQLRFFAPAKFGLLALAANRHRRSHLCTIALFSCFLSITSISLAQASTTATMDAVAAGTVSGSIVTMTAHVLSAGQPVTGGTVTFRDTFAGAAQDLGTVQVQSANGTPGLATLKTEVGGAGPHSIVAIYNAPKGYASSMSGPAALTFQLPYSSATSVAIAGSAGTYTLTGTVSAFGPTQPSGSLVFKNQTTDSIIATVPLDSSTGTQGFTPPVLYRIPVSTPWNTSSEGTPVSGDFNGDGHPDFAIPTSLGPILIMIGHGDGTFQPGASIQAAEPFGLVVGDFNGDGNQDIATSNKGTSGSVAIYLGNGDGTFAAGEVYPVAPGGLYQVMQSGDFNVDGIADLVVSDSLHDQVAVLLGKGDGTFLAPKLFATTSIPWNIAIGDINGDGNPDLAIASDGEPSIAILLGNGDGTFHNGTYPVGGEAGQNASSGSVAFADFNGDGKLDLAASEESTDSIFIFLGNRDGTFQTKQRYTITRGPYYLGIGDFNQDGTKDIITANAEGESMGVLLGNGDGTFQSASTYPAGGPAIYAAVQDFNGDSQVDTVVVTNNGLQVYLAGNAQTATFSPFTVTTCSTQSIVASYTGDTNYSTSTSPVASVSQNGVATTISVVQTPENATYGQTVTLTATLTAQGSGNPSSDGMTVTFYDGTVKLGTGSLSSEIATLSVTSLKPGPHSFTAVFDGNCSLTGSTSSAIVENVGKATPIITWPNPASIPYGTALTPAQLNATASVAGTFSYSPAVGAIPVAGTSNLSVTFAPTDTDDYETTTATVPLTVTQGTLTLTAQNATRTYGSDNPTFSGSIIGALNGDTFTETFTTSAISTSSPGSYAIVPSATGPALANYTEAVTNGTLTITQAASAASIMPSATTIAQGDSLTLTVTVTPATAGTPTGTVNLVNNGNPLGSAILANGVATYTATSLSPGNAVIAASYSGDVNFGASTATAVTVTIAQNVLTIKAADASRVYGASNPTFAGTITGAKNGDTFTEAFTTSATATSAPGTYAIVPAVSGTNLTQYQQSLVNGTLTITKASVSNSIGLSATAITQGQNETVTATVTSSTTGNPTGSVTFFNNGNQLGTATLANGKVTYSTTALPVGNNVITFTYAGDANFNANTASPSSGANTVVVAAPTPLDFSFQVVNATGLIGHYGQSMDVKLHVSPTAGQYPGAIQFAISGTPTVPATYTFSPSTVDAAAGDKDVTMTIQFQASARVDHASPLSGRVVSIAFAALILPWISVTRIRKSGRRLGQSVGLSALLLIVFGAAVSITGCGSSSATSPTTPSPVTSSIVINATSGTVQHAVTVSVAVQK
jgi:hypothetical protein